MPKVYGRRHVRQEAQQRDLCDHCRHSPGTPGYVLYGWYKGKIDIGVQTLLEFTLSEMFLRSRLFGCAKRKLKGKYVGEHGVDPALTNHAETCNIAAGYREDCTVLLETGDRKIYDVAYAHHA